MKIDRVTVHTRDAYQEAQDPIAFEWEGHHYRVAQILDRWYEGYPDSTRMPLRYFKVRTEEGVEFLLRYHPFFRAWGLILSPHFRNR